MGYDLYLKKVNKKGLQEILKYCDLNDLSYEDINKITEDEVNSFLNVFEDYFHEKDIFYRYGDYQEISIGEFNSMFEFLQNKLSKLSDSNDWDYKLTEMVLNNMKTWKDCLSDSVILFEHDC